MLAKHTTEQFIEKARAVHGPLYDYSQVEYKGAFVKVQVGCPTHGIFEQTPNSHLSGKGCLRCCNVGNKNGTKWTTENFVAECVRLYPNLDFSKVVLNKIVDRVTVGCPVHGEYDILAYELLRKKRRYSCRLCAFEAKKVGRVAKHTWLDRFRAKHGTLYCYRHLPDLILALDKIPIECSVHGVFHQQAYVHSRGSGCPGCREELKAVNWVEQCNGRMATLYFIRLYSAAESFFKVGVTYRTVASRYGSAPFLPDGFAYEVLAQYQSLNAAAVYDWEQKIIERFAHLRYRPVVGFDGASECFRSSDEILAAWPIA